VTIENMKNHLNLLKGKKGRKRVNQRIKREKGGALSHYGHVNF
jgi:hypothetical protein